MNIKKIIKALILWFCIGAIYFVMEGIWRIPKGGYANIVMLPIGGLCGLVVGYINQIPKFYKLKVLYQSLIGAALTLCVEFMSGLVLNVWLGLEIWDYSHLPFNVMGQICLVYGILWVVLMPFAIWFEDTLRWGFWRERKPYSLIDIYRDFLTFK